MTRVAVKIVTENYRDIDLDSKTIFHYYPGAQTTGFEEISGDESILLLRDGGTIIKIRCKHRGDHTEFVDY